MFSRLLKSEARRRLLKLLIDNPQKKFYLRELAEMINYSPGSLQRELALLLEDQLLIEERLGNMRFFGINQSSPFIKQLQLELNETAHTLAHISSPKASLPPPHTPPHTPPRAPAPTHAPISLSQSGKLNNNDEQAKSDNTKEQKTHLTIHIE